MTAFFTRRDLGWLAFATTTQFSTARAQPRPQPVVRAIAPPCPERPGDIVGLVLEGSGSPAGTVVVFGQAFRAGDLPQGERLAARLAGGPGGGRPLAVQADITTRHADGSARFAVVSLASPALRAGERAAVLLARTAEAAPPPLDTVASGSGRSAVVEIAPADGAAPWRVDLLLRFQDAVLQRFPGAVWQQGALAVQARIALPVPPAAVGGASSARLVADLALRADGTLWADVWLRNDAAMRPGGGPVQYSMRLLLDGREALGTGPIRQLQYTGFGRLRGAAGGGPAQSPPLVRHDVAYLGEVGAVARYDLSVGVEERRLAEMARHMAAPEWETPLAPRRIVQDMGTAGGRPDIGPTTLWQAAWLVSGDARAARFAEGQAEAGGAIPWHFWDASGGADGGGGWMDTRRWPEFWTDPRGGQPPKTLLQPMPTRADAVWVADTAHKPALSFVPYLLTGRRSLLDQMVAEAFWCILSMWPARRLETADVPAVRDVNVVSGAQIRGAAWSMRDLGNAAWIMPDDHANAGYLRAAHDANWTWVRAMTAKWSAMQGEARGWIFGNYAIGARGETSPWQQDFFVASAATAARRGNADARAVLAWMENFIVGRFLAAERGFNPRDGVAYQFPLAPAGGPNPAYFQSWAEIGAETRARDMSNDESWRRSNGYYGPLGLHSLAAMAEILDSQAARRAHAWLAAAAPPHTAQRDYATDPTWSVTAPIGRVRSCARMQ
jgi:hypothetical protein